MDYCYGCMRKRAANEAVCPDCGYRHEGETWPAFALRPGTLLHNGKYLIGKVLGQGGFGITYMGLDTALEMKVAIKEYYPMNQVNRSSVTDGVLWHSASDGGSSGRESFLKEARRMARVDAIPGIVQVKDIFYQKNTAYIVMNFIEGETLKEKLLRDGIMTPEECIHTLTPVMEALEQAHQSGLIHRDISPDNIMIDRKGKLWVLDMGAAKDLESGSGPTQSSQAVTKRGFSPPEQSIGSGRGKIGPWTDVYAMCATIYYCLTGRLVPEAMERLLNDELSFPSSVPSPMASTLRNGLALRSSDRTQTMAQMLRELNGELATKDQEGQKEPKARFYAKNEAPAPTLNTSTQNSPNQSTVIRNTANRNTTTQNTTYSSKQKTTAQNKTMTLEEYLTLATRYGDAEDYRQQMTILRDAQKQFPDIPGIYNLMGIACRNLGEYYEAIECYRRASELDPDNGAFLTNAGIAILCSGRPQEALAYFEKGLPLLKKADSPVYPIALGNYALALAQAGYADNAVRCLKEATQLGYVNAGEVRRQMEALGVFYH